MRKWIFQHATTVLFSIVFIFTFIYSLTFPYLDHDPLFYQFIGQHIYHDGQLPYSAGFDHKPIGIYYLYGLLSVSLPLNWPKLQMLSAACYLISGWLICKLSNSRRYAFTFLLLALLGYPFITFSGNTELILSVLILWVAYLARHPNPASWFWAGCVGCFAINSNYLAVLLIGPLLLGYLWIHMRAGQAGIMTLACSAFLGALACLIVMFLPYLLTGQLDKLSEYITLQRAFLSTYGDETSNVTTLLKRMIFIVPIIMICVVGRKRWDGHTLIAVMMILGAIAACAVSKKFYPHYFYLAIAFLIIVYQSVESAWKKRAELLQGVLILLAGIYLPYKYFPHELPAAMPHYQELANRVGKQPVLVIRASIVPVYYGQLFLLQPVAFFNHAALIYGAQEDALYQRYLHDAPTFVLGNSDLCHDASLVQTCQSLTLDYQPVMSIRVNEFTSQTLYRHR